MLFLVLVTGLFAGCAPKQDSGEDQSQETGENDTSEESEEPDRIEGFEDYITGIGDLTLPEGTRIVALGEATHGNREFQQSKREVFAVLVEKYDIRALVIEGDFGGCSLINDYIQGGDGDPRELTPFLGYQLYRTEDMLDLIEWMREYNRSADGSDRVRLYGMDVQRSDLNVRFLKEFYEKVDSDKAEEVSETLDELFGTEPHSYKADRTDEILEYTDFLMADIDDHADTYAERTDADEVFRARLAAQSLSYFINLLEKENYSNKYRDGAMKAIVDEVLAYEEAEHGSELMLACHNGHMTKNQSSMATFLGKDLHDELGDKYFAIGTDFYITDCNLPVDDGRTVVRFCSDDPLAYNMQFTGLDKGLLDFSKVDAESALYPYITKAIPTGSLGEGYTPGMEDNKRAYQMNFAPADMYDAMILYYETTPTEVWAD